MDSKRILLLLLVRSGVQRMLVAHHHNHMEDETAADEVLHHSGVPDAQPSLGECDGSFVRHVPDAEDRRTDRE